MIERTFIDEFRIACCHQIEVVRPAPFGRESLFGVC